MAPAQAMKLPRPLSASCQDAATRDSSPTVPAVQMVSHTAMNSDWSVLGPEKMAVRAAPSASTIPGQNQPRLGLKRYPV